VKNQLHCNVITVWQQEANFKDLGPNCWP